VQGTFAVGADRGYGIGFDTVDHGRAPRGVKVVGMMVMYCIQTFWDIYSRVEHLRNGSWRSAIIVQ
jgi:hypothetical protein